MAILSAGAIAGSITLMIDIVAFQPVLAIRILVTQAVLSASHSSGSVGGFCTETGCTGFGDVARSASGADDGAGFVGAEERADE